MKLNRTWKIVVGLVSLWVVAYPLVMMVGLFSIFPLIAMQENSSSSEIPFFFPAFLILMTFIVFTSFLQMAVSAFYLAHVIKNKKGLEVLRIILGVGTFYLPHIALPVYYFIYIWPETCPDWALERGSA